MVGRLPKESRKRSSKAMMVSTEQWELRVFIKKAAVPRRGHSHQAPRWERSRFLRLRTDGYKRHSLKPWTSVHPWTKATSSSPAAPASST